MKSKSCHFKSKSYHLKSKSYHFKSKSYHLKSKSYHFKSKSYHLKSKSRHFKSKSYHWKSESYHLKSKSYHLKFKSYHFKSESYHLKSTSGAKGAPVILTKYCSNSTTMRYHVGKVERIHLGGYHLNTDPLTDPHITPLKGDSSNGDWGTGIHLIHLVLRCVIVNGSMFV